MALPVLLSSSVHTRLRSRRSLWYSRIHDWAQNTPKPCTKHLGSCTYPVFLTSLAFCISLTSDWTVDPPPSTQRFIASPRTSCLCAMLGLTRGSTVLHACCRHLVLRHRLSPHPAATVRLSGYEPTNLLYVDLRWLDHN